MALNTKTIHAKIRSVKNVKKITKAMEKVSAVKMRRAVAQSSATREYAYHLFELLETLLRQRGLQHPFLTSGAGSRSLLVILSTDRGLCGALNIQIQRTVAEYAAKYKNEVDTICVGRKAELMSQRLGLPIVSSFVGLPDTVQARNVSSIATVIKTEFLSGRYARAAIVYSHFDSTISYTPTVYQILPLTREELGRTVARLSKGRTSARTSVHSSAEYTFEPTDETVINAILPKAVDAKLMKMTAETRACEHSARLVAMRSASDSAQTLIDDLTVRFNKARQDAITREIAEIAGAALAVGSQ